MFDSQLQTSYHVCYHDYYLDTPKSALEILIFGICRLNIYIETRSDVVE